MSFGHICFFACLVLLSLVSHSYGATCSVAATEYSVSGCSAANLVGCSRHTSLAEGSCTQITSLTNSSSSLYLLISNCSASNFSVHLSSGCSDVVDYQDDACSTAAPYFSFAVYEDGTPDASAPYCAQANSTCPFTLISFNDLECTQLLKCAARSSNQDGVCVYEPAVGLYLLPRCQTAELVVSSQPTCSGGLTRTFANVNVSVGVTCSPFGNNQTTFTAYFDDNLTCGSASLVNWLHQALSLLF